MSLGKLLAQPITLLVGIALVALLLVKRGERARRTGIVLAVLSLALLLILSVPMTSIALEKSLQLPESGDRFAPEVIDVPGSGLGYKGPFVSVLPHDGVARVVAAVEWWRHYPKARIVMSGGAISEQTYGAQSSARMVDLAAQLGVPRNQLFAEPRSRNTREHAVEMRRFPFVTAETRIGVCTSPWHLRRALHSFRHQFRFVEGHAAPLDPPPESLAERWLPSDEGLTGSTRMLDEWIGLVWYRLRDLADR